MHELSICRDIIRQVEDLAIQHDAASVTNIKICIGPLSGIEPQLLAQAFTSAATESIAENAELEIEVMPIRVRCQQCHAESEATINRLICGVCGHTQTRLLSGDEMLLTSVEFAKTG